MTDIALQRRRDEAFFEDWSEWDSLDDLPMPDKGRGRYVRRPDNHHRYYCRLNSTVNWMGGPAFEIAIPGDNRIYLLLKAVPGIRRHPGLNGTNQFAFHRMQSTYFTPAESWRELRAALPAIKAATIKWVHTPR